MPLLAFWLRPRNSDIDARVRICRLPRGATLASPEEVSAYESDTALLQPSGTQHIVRNAFPADEPPFTHVSLHRLRLQPTHIAIAPKILIGRTPSLLNARSVAEVCSAEPNWPRMRCKAPTRRGAPRGCKAMRHAAKRCERSAVRGCEALQGPSAQRASANPRGALRGPRVPAF